MASVSIEIYHFENTRMIFITSTKWTFTSIYIYLECFLWDIVFFVTKQNEQTDEIPIEMSKSRKRSELRAKTESHPWIKPSTKH